MHHKIVHYQEFVGTALLYIIRYIVGTGCNHWDCNKVLDSGHSCKTEPVRNFVVVGQKPVGVLVFGFEVFS